MVGLSGYGSKNYVLKPSSCHKYNKSGQCFKFLHDEFRGVDGACDMVDMDGFVLVSFMDPIFKGVDVLSAFICVGTSSFNSSLVIIHNYCGDGISHVKVSNQEFDGEELLDALIGVHDFHFT